jgi:hypothetical protein
MRQTTTIEPVTCLGGNGYDDDEDAMATIQTNQLSDLSQIIGELRNFAAQQAVTNTHMLEELKKIGDRMSGFSEVNASLKEYRNVLHERFARIHEILGQVDERLDKIENRQRSDETLLAGWKANLRMGLGVGWVISTLLASFFASFGAGLFRALGQLTR